MNRKYTSYKEIERDLAIVEVEREIHKQKIFRTFGRAKSGVSNFAKGNMLKSALTSASKLAITLGKSSSLKSLIYSYLLQTAVKKIFNR